MSIVDLNGTVVDETVNNNNWTIKGPGGRSKTVNAEPSVDDLKAIGGEFGMSKFKISVNDVARVVTLSPFDLAGIV